MLQLSPALKEKFPGLMAQMIYMEGLKVGRGDPAIKELEAEIAQEVQENFTLENVKDTPLARKNRDFFWKVKVDPTKTRPAGEALIRRLLQGRPLPTINNMVDAYNLASVKTELALAAFDLDKVFGMDPILREATPGEEFVGIGMKKPKVLKGGEPVIEDEKQLIAIYPHRDADYSKITKTTTSVLLLICGVPGIEKEYLKKSGEVAVNFLKRFCGGKVVLK